MEHLMPFVVDGLSWLALASGGLFILIGAIGLHRLPDFWARLHAAGVIDTAGAGLMIVGLMLQAGLSLVTLKLALIGVSVFITSPTATHAIAQAAFAAGLRPAALARDASGEFVSKERRT